MSLLAKRKVSGAFVALLVVICLVVGFVVGFVGMAEYRTIASDQAPAEAPYVEKLTGSVPGEISIHFLELGNAYTIQLLYQLQHQTRLRFSILHHIQVQHLQSILCIRAKMY